MKRLLLTSLLALACLVPVTATAQAPPLVPVQGTLYGTDGLPVEGTQNVTFTLYAGPDGLAQWTDTFEVTFTGGLFTVYIGEETPLDLGLFQTYGNLYVGVQVEGTELGRFPLATTAYGAFSEYCGDALTLDGLDADALTSRALDATAGLYSPVGHTHPWGDITGVPTGLADGDDVLTPAEVDAIVADNGYLTASSELAWARITGVPADLADGDDVLDETAVDAMVADNGYLSSTSDLAWGRLTGVPAGLTDGDDVLTEAEVDAMVADNGYLNGSSALPWDNLTGVPPGFADGIDNDTTLDEAAVDAMVADNGYLTASSNVAWARLTGVPSGLADGDNVLTESQVDAYANNNGYLTGSSSLAWARLTGVPAGFADGVDNNTQLSSSTVRSYMDNQPIERHSCIWYPSSTGYVNNMDGVMNFTCPSGGVLAGFYSYHSNGTEDRQWRAYCCQLRVNSF